MSFICQKCGKKQGDGSIPVLFVAEQRNKTYPERYNEEELIDKGGSGYEAVREIQICKECDLAYKEKKNGSNF